MRPTGTAVATTTTQQHVVAQFLEAVMHSILYHRNVYPPSSFETTQLYGMVVHYNRHPQVADYVREVATKALSGGSHAIGEVRMLVYHERDEGGDGDGDGDGERDRETYRLLFSPTDRMAPADRDTDQIDRTNEREAEKLKWFRMHDDFKATLLRIEVLCKSRAVDMPVVPTDPDALAGRTFRVQLVTTTMNGDDDMGRETAPGLDDGWMVVERPAAPSGPRRATPVHTVRLVDGIDVSIRME